ncbi:MAG: LamG domain-containing protein [Spirochaetota bacterium]
MRSIAVFMLFASLCSAEMVLRFPFDEDKGTSTADVSGAVTALAQNCTWTDGRSGSALKFTPAEKSAVIVKAPLRVKDISISLWFKSDSDQKDPHLACCIGDGKQGFRIFMNGNIIIWQLPSAEIAWGYRLGATAASVPGQWNHVVCTYDGEAMYIYLNGKAAGSMKRSGSIVTPTVPLIIGAYSDAGTAVFSGSIDDVAVYDNALTLEEAKALYASADAAKGAAKTERIDMNVSAAEAMRNVPNELKNASFEESGQWAMQHPWTTAEGGIAGPRTAQIAYDKDKHHKFLEQTVTVSPNAFYAMRLWFRSEFTDDTHIVRGLGFFAGNAKNEPLFTYTSHNAEFAYWVPVYHFFNSGESTSAKFSVYLEGYSAAANLWADDAALWKLSDDELKGALIPNADFELNANGDFPVCWADGLGWQKEKRPPLKISTDDSADFIRGKSSLKLDGSSFTAADTENGVVSVAVPAITGKEYRLSVWMKAEKPETAARLMIDGHQPGKTHWFKQTYVTLDTAWRRFTFDARIPDAADAKYYLPARLVMARIMVKGPNVIWADEVKLTQK